ncbi:DUF3097 family protein [Pseudoclavibacter sp. CFCC 13611]|uniref:DUF3097 family protein n=1 Tax=Pseudoclavibacter sp. CFCC 13611 TaxID=2615178 RepID=UPI001301612A|nr:DUF3097 family protein [Pseudoclavibacter sp. CFCC 13611]KAB1662678.1 DUF3097 family protein [Pseudoclavibacter sp. CFCC 13611]
MFDDRYDIDPLADQSWRRTVGPKRVAAQLGEVYEDVASGFCGALVRFDRQVVELEDRHGAVRAFQWGPGLLLEGKPIDLVHPGDAARGVRGAGRAGTAGSPAARGAAGSAGRAAESLRIGASGMRVDPNQRARVARASRLFVEGKHDAELVVKVWGDDLKATGVVVEQLLGVDHLAEVMAEFEPGPTRRMGVLVDHLVKGSKESHIVDALPAGPARDAVLVVGHPFIDIWQAVKPERLGIRAWPSIPRGIDWKSGMCRALGWPGETGADVGKAWSRILGTVRSYRDLEPSLTGRVEQLIDFVTEIPE